MTLISGKACVLAAVPGAGGWGGGPVPLLFLPGFLLPPQALLLRCVHAEAQRGEDKVLLPPPQPVNTQKREEEEGEVKTAPRPWTQVMLGPTDTPPKMQCSAKQV